MVQTPVGAKSNPWIVYMKECRAIYNEKKSESNLTRAAVGAREAMPVGPKAKRNETKEETNGTNETKVANKKRTPTRAVGSTLAAFLP
jgi:hypothetical protein